VPRMVSSYAFVPSIYEDAGVFLVHVPGDLPLPAYREGSAQDSIDHPPSIA